MANPPALGKGSRLSRRALGWSAQPTRKEKERTAGIKRQVTPHANPKVKITASQPVPLGLAMPRDLRKSYKFISQYLPRLPIMNISLNSTRINPLKY
jgi:hypothetical protein